MRECCFVHFSGNVCTCAQVYWSVICFPIIHANQSWQRQYAHAVPEYGVQFKVMCANKLARNTTTTTTTTTSNTYNKWFARQLYYEAINSSKLTTFRQRYDTLWMFLKISAESSSCFVSTRSAWNLSSIHTRYELVFTVAVRLFLSAATWECKNIFFFNFVYGMSTWALQSPVVWLVKVVSWNVCATAINRRLPGHIMSIMRSIKRVQNIKRVLKQY